MKPTFPTCIRILGAVALSVALGACAYSPGMRFDAAAPVDPTNEASTPDVQQITPDLVASERREREAAADSAAESLAADKAPYRIGAGDILSIVVWDHPELVLPTQTYAIGAGTTELTLGDTTAGIPGYPVSADGYIQFPYLGLLHVAGLTEEQVRDLIIANAGDYIKHPQITVRVLGFRSQRVYVEGEIRTPGTVAINDLPMTVTEAINRAGGMLPTADRSRILVVRGGKSIRVDIPRLIARGTDLGGLMLQPGDIVRVSPRDETKIFVMGEVNNPLAVPLRDGSLSLNEALGTAGGVNQNTANSAQIFVVRTTPSALPEIYHLDARSAGAMSVAEQFELKPKDVVFVDAGNLVRWNRFISLLFPSTQTLQTASAVGR